MARPGSAGPGRDGSGDDDRTWWPLAEGRISCSAGSCCYFLYYFCVLLHYFRLLLGTACCLCAVRCVICGTIGGLEGEGRVVWAGGVRWVGWWEVVGVTGWVDECVAKFSKEGMSMFRGQTTAVGRFFFRLAWSGRFDKWWGEGGAMFSNQQKLGASRPRRRAVFLLPCLAA